MKSSFDKYFYYTKSVQNPEEDIKFFRQTYKKIFKKNPTIFREDFCGTFYIAYHWVKASINNKAIGIDIDKTPLEYGKAHHIPKLSSSEKSHLEILNKSVLQPNLPKAEIITVSNFSYFIFKERKILLKYFKNVKKALMKQGLFIIDIFGGPDCEKTSEEFTKHTGFNYYWDQVSFNPINNDAHFYIHFKRKGETKRQKIFSYDWRMWSIPELKDILAESGFSKIHVFWEQTNKKGEGTGVFKKTLKGDICDTWIAYLICES